MSDIVKCLYCGRITRRRHSRQIFCPKNKRGRHLCKDRFHNQRRFEARPFDPNDYMHPFEDDAVQGAV